MIVQSDDQAVGVKDIAPTSLQPPPLVKRDTFGHSVQHPNDILAQLISMGFSPSMAETAIFESGNTSLDRALAWLLDSHEPVPDEEPEIQDAPSEEEDTSEFYVETDNDVRIQKKVPPPPTTQPQKSILKTTSVYQNLPGNSSKSRIRDWIFGGPKVTTHANTKVNASNFMRNTIFKSKGSTHHPEPTISLDDDDDILEPAEKEVKKVRFCTDLQTEVPPSPVDWSATHATTSDESEAATNIEEQKPRAEEMYTPGQVLEHYEATCHTREVPVIRQLVSAMKRAENRNQILSNIELQSVQFTRDSMLTFTDSLDLPFGLTKLTLENCGIDDDLLKTLVHSLIFTCQISELSLARNKKIKHGGLRYIGLFIKKSQHLKHLDLSGIPLDKKAARQIGPYFAARQKNGLESLKLDECGLKSNVLEFIVPSLRRSSIRNLSLRKNQINHVGALWIGVLLRDYEDDIAPEIIYSRTRPYPPPVSGWKVGLERLDVSMNEIKGGVQYLAQSLKRNLMLKELILAQNGIDTHGIVQLADSLAVNKNLKSFDLSRNPCSLSIDGIIAIRSALASNNSLETLVLSETRMNSEGAIALAEFLPETKYLKNLDISSNPDIDIAGVLALSVSLRMNWSIVCLDVSVVPDDPVLAELSRDILSTCIRNMEKIPESNASNNTSLHNDDASDTKETITLSQDPPNTVRSEIEVRPRLQIESEEVEAPIHHQRSIKFSEPPIATHSQDNHPDAVQNESSGDTKSHSTMTGQSEELREKDRTMVSKEASALVAKHMNDEPRVRFDEESVVAVFDDSPVANSLKNGQIIQLNLTPDKTNPHIKRKNKSLETQEAQTLLNSHPRNEDKKVQFGEASLIEVKQQTDPSYHLDPKQTVEINTNSKGQTLKIKEKSKCMELEEAQAMRNSPILDTNKQVQFGHTKLIEVPAEEPILLNPKEEKSVELSPTPETQNPQVKEKGKRMGIEEAQALRKPLDKTEIKKGANISHAYGRDSQPAPELL